MADITGTQGVPFSVGVALDGHGWHPAAWREASDPAAIFTSDYWTSLAQTADRSGIHYLTLDDTLHLQGTADEAAPRPREDRVQGRFDALLTLSWVAPHTERVGLIPTVTVTHTEPFHIGTALQTLDHISLGRAGWQLRFSTGVADSAAFGRRGPEGIPLDEAVAEAAEVAEVARGLWDSWEDDAVIRDRPTGRFLDREKLHYVDFEGERFSVKGPSIVPRSPQGQLPVTLLAHATEIYELAARVADVVFVTPRTAADAVAVVAELREIEAAVGRAELGLEPLRIVVDLLVAIDDTAEAAAARIARLDELAGESLTSDARLVAGSADDVADAIAELRQVAAVDGVRLRPITLPHDLERIADELIPELRSRGIADPASDTVQLRQRFALPPAVNRYAAGTEPAARTESTQTQNAEEVSA